MLTIKSFNVQFNFLYRSPNTQRFNYNGLGGNGVYPQGIPPNGAFPQGGYPQGVGGYPSAFNGPHGPVRGQYQPNYGGGFGATGAGIYPGVGIGGGQYPGGNIGGGHYPGGIGAITGNLGPIGGLNHGIHSGQVPVLVGPGIRI